VAINIEDNEITNCNVGIQAPESASNVNIRRNRISQTGVAVLLLGKAPKEILEAFHAEAPISQIDAMCKQYTTEKPEIADEESAKTFLEKYDLVKWLGVTHSALSVIEQIKSMLN